MRFTHDHASEATTKLLYRNTRWASVAVVAFASFVTMSCGGFSAITRQTTRSPTTTGLPGFVDVGSGSESMRVLRLEPGVTATIVAPAKFDPHARVDLILYALPNGNTTAQTMGHRMLPGDDWHFDIQNIAAQTRALRSRGMTQAVVVYLEANTLSWPEWRRVQGYDQANTRIVGMVDQVRRAIGNPFDVAVTLTGHSGGGSFIWGFIEGQTLLPPWLQRIAFLDANYSFETKHGDKIAAWLRDASKNTLEVVAYDDREIMLDGKKVVTDSGGTWRATQRMLDYFHPIFPMSADTLNEFQRFHNTQIEMVRHPNPSNRILHTEMIGEMNAYMHVMLVRTPGYDKTNAVLRHSRAYLPFIEGAFALPVAAPPAIPARLISAMSGSAFIASVAPLPNEERELAVQRELMAGNIPSFLRSLRKVSVTALASDSSQHTISYEVMPDYLAIGSDEDFVRMPMNPYTAQAFCDAFGFVLPTRKMVNDIWKAATKHVEPHPLTEQRESPLTFLQHDRIVADQLKGTDRKAFVAGNKKDVVISHFIAERPDRVSIYGWHYLSGEPIQPLYGGHVDWYVDYSHGIRPVRRMMRVDGVELAYEKIVGDSLLFPLVSDEGVIKVPRYVKLTK